jgi:hypothetical protein
MSGIRPGYKSPVARSVPFDNSSNGFIAEDTQAAIEEVSSVAANSASPGFTWGRSGSIPKGAWFQNETVPSNKSGRTMFLVNAVIEKVFVSNESPDIITVEVYTHDGDEVNLTLVGSVTTAALRSNTFSTSFPIPVNKQIAMRLAGGSANDGKNTIAGILVKGDLV